MKLLTMGGLRLEKSTFRRKTPLLLLVYLSLEGRKERDYLADLFWQCPRRQPSRKKRHNNLSRVLSDLRKFVPGSFEATSSSVWSCISTDWHEIQKACDDRDYYAINQLHQGPFMEGCLGGWGVELEEWILGQRDLVNSRIQAVLLDLAEQEANKGAEEKACKLAERAFLLSEPPLEMLERFQNLFCLTQSGLLKALEKLALSYGQPLITLPLKVQAESANNLAPMPKGFIGREKELATILPQLKSESCRLLNLMGSGGIGKSRLALHIAHQLLRTGTFSGIYLINLEALASAAQIPMRLAEAMSVTLSARETVDEQITRQLADRRLLLIFDNFEHVIEGASLLSCLLKACSNITVLVTSRERLNLEEEWVFPLEGLKVPVKGDVESAIEVDAVSLFVKRAKRARLTFEIDEHNLLDVIAICQALEGSPLGIELAAAWVKMMSPESILAEITSNVDVLRVASRNKAERHMSLEATFEHSWIRLSEEEQQAFKALAVFRGGFTKEAAEQVTGAKLSVLASLIDRSLLRMASSGRYDRHPLIYQYAYKRLKKDKALFEKMQEGHASYYSLLAEQARPHLRGQEQALWFERLEAEHDNIRASLSWAIGQAKTLAIKLAGDIWWFWYIRGYYTEGREWLSKALALSKEATQERAQALKALGVLATQQNNCEQSKCYFSESLGIFKALELQREVAVVLNNLAGAVFYQGDYATALSYVQESLDIYRTLKDKAGIAVTLAGLGTLAFEQENYAQAKDYLEEHLMLSRELGHKKDVAHALNSLRYIAWRQKDYEQAQCLCEESLRIREEIGDQDGIADSNLSLGDLAWKRNDRGEAKTFYAKALTLWQHLGHLACVALALEKFARLAVDETKYAKAARLLAVAERLRERVNAPPRLSDKALIEKLSHCLQHRFNAKEGLVLKEEGYALSLEQASRYALDTLDEAGFF